MQYLCVFKMCFFSLSSSSELYSFLLFFPSICPVSHHLPSSTLQQMIPPLLALSQNRSKLKLYIAHLTDLCHDRDPGILSQLTPPTHYHHSDPDHWEEELQKMSVEQVAARSARDLQQKVKFRELGIEIGHIYLIQLSVFLSFFFFLNCFT